MAYKYIGSTSGISLDPESKRIRDSFVGEKAEYFLEYRHFSNKEDLMSFCKEVFDMIDDDLQNSVFEWNGLDSAIDDITKAKRITILNNYICSVIGYVFLNVFNVGDNQLRGATNGFEGAINPRDMLIYGYLELNEKRQREDLHRPAYGANFVFMSLIEEELKLHIKRYYGKKYIFELKSKIDNGLVTLNPTEDVLYDYLCHNYEIINTRNHNIEIDTIAATGYRQYNLLNRYTDINQKREIAKLFQGQETLNGLRAKQYFTDIVDDRFATLLEYLFSNSNLALRNNMAHGNMTSINYHDIGYTALLYMICLIISDEHFYK